MTLSIKNKCFLYTKCYSAIKIEVIWCIFIVRNRFAPPPSHMTCFLYIETFLRKTKTTDLLEMVWKKKLSKNFFARINVDPPKILAKFSDLLLFVVATKKIYRFFLYRKVSVHLKKFSRARAPKTSKMLLKLQMDLLVL